MEESTPAPKETSPLHAEEIHMLEGLEDEELELYLDENPRIVPLFEIDVGETAESYASPTGTTGHDDELGEDAIVELRHAQEAFEREMETLRRVITTELEEINVGTTDDPRTISITKNLPPTTRTAMITLLGEYRDVFTWSYEDMKGLDPKFYQHQINLATDAKPVQQRRYRMNPNYAARVKEKIDKFLKIGFIRSVKRVRWLSPIVVVPQKNGKIRVCVDYRKLNVVTVIDDFSLSFTNSVLDAVAGHEMYSFLDGFNGYHQVRIHRDNQEKKAFITEWGVFVVVVMMFGLKNALATFQPINLEVFEDYIPAFM